MQFILGLLPLMNSSNSDTGARVLSILSGGVHSPFIDRNDLELRKNYSIGNAANAAGFYNDLGLDVLSSQNPSISFIHAAPGFVRTEWGKSFPSYLKNPLRLMQSTLAKSPEDCAKCMVQGLTSSRFSPFTNKQNGETPTNIHIMNEKGLSGSVTNAHTEEVN